VVSAVVEAGEWGATADLEAFRPHRSLEMEAY